jgi:hypothetical protein
MTLPPLGTPVIRTTPPVGSPRSDAPVPSDPQQPYVPEPQIPPGPTPEQVEQTVDGVVGPLPEGPPGVTSAPAAEGQPPITVGQPGQPAMIGVTLGGTTVTVTIGR